MNNVDRIPDFQNTLFLWNVCVTQQYSMLSQSRILFYNYLFCGGDVHSIPLPHLSGNRLLYMGLNSYTGTDC